MSETELIVPSKTRIESAFSSMDAFVNAQRMAKMLVSSPLVPKEYQGEQNLGSAVIALELAQRMDMSPLMVMQNLDIIHGRPSWRAQMVIAAVNACGRFSPLRYEMGDDPRNPSCRASATDLANGELLLGTLIDMDMAKAEGWYGKSGSKWKTIPELMLRYRAATWWGRQYAPELLMGLPIADESREIIDVTPTVVDGPASRVGSVADSLAANEQEQDEPQDDAPPWQDAAQWPQKDEDGYWIDSRGYRWDGRAHGIGKDGSPSVLHNGVFRRRRGCSPELLKEIEDAEMARLNPVAKPTPDHEPDPDMDSAPAPEPQDQSDNPKIGYPEIREAIGRATNSDDLDLAEDLLGSTDTEPSLTEDLAEMISVKRAEMGL